MFDLFYKKYKLDVLGKEPWIDFRGAKPYEIGCCLSSCALIILFSVLISVGKILFAIAVLVCVLLIIGFFVIIRKNPEEQRRLISDRFEPFWNERIKNTISLLQEFGIEVDDTQKINEIIKKARAQKKEHDVWKNTKNVLGIITQFFLAPFITVLLTEYVKKTEIITLVKIAVIVAVILMLIVMLAYSLAENINIFLNFETRKLESLISDLEDIIIFKNIPDKNDEILVRIDENSKVAIDSDF